MRLGRLLFICEVVLYVSGDYSYLRNNWGHYDKKYGPFAEKERLIMVEEAKKMFYFGYDNYMKYAFPKDELDPIHCDGRGPDYEDRTNININDVLGDYSLTLIDALDTLAIMGNSSEFKRAVMLIAEHVSFNKPNTIQVFEATIRVLGALISAHLIIKDPKQPFGEMRPAEYDNELLYMAHDLAGRLLPAFDSTATGLPYPRVNLQTGVPSDCVNETCTSGAGSILLEFGMLSRLLDDPVYESVARRTVQQLWKFRSNVTGLFGNVINIQTGKWVGQMSGLGAGLDSFFEYLLKAYIMFGDKEDFRMFNESYETIKFYLRKGRKYCNNGTGHPPLYVNVNMRSGEVLNNWIDALQAAWPGVQVLNGDVEEAICMHAFYYAIWKRYEALPERYNWHLKAPDVHFYPLRPELVESTYLLYQATKNPFYLHVGRDILYSLNNHTKAECGYATIHDVKNKELEDRMESFFLSETTKYLYLLFDTDNHLNKAADQYVFTTEGHILPLKYKFRSKGWQREAGLFDMKSSFASGLHNEHPHKPDLPLSNFSDNCKKIPTAKQYFLPLDSHYIQQIDTLVGLDIS